MKDKKQELLAAIKRYGDAREVIHKIPLAAKRNHENHVDAWLVVKRLVEELIPDERTKDRNVGGATVAEG